MIASISIKAQELPFGLWVTNSIFVAALVLVLVGGFAIRATKNMTLIPHPAQNFFEWIVDFLYGQVEGIVGKSWHRAPFPCWPRSLFSFWYRTGSVCCPAWGPWMGKAGRGAVGTR